MRFIGSKKDLLSYIENTIFEYTENEFIFGDLFCGMGSVTSHFKKLGHSIVANDNLNFCSIIAKSILLNNSEPTFSNLMDLKEIHTCNDKLFPTPYEKVLCYLNRVKENEGFIYNNYSSEGTSNQNYHRNYFSGKNAIKIDSIRNKILEWEKEGLLNEAEKSLLLNDLFLAVNKVANTAGTYGMFLKNYSDKRIFKTLELVSSNIIKSDKYHIVHNEDANKIVNKIKCDVLYLDPPYNWRQYGAYYHILETIARWDNPILYGLSGLRQWEDTKSRYCYKSQALDALLEIIDHTSAPHIFISYNSEGIISHDNLTNSLSEYGKITITEREYRRYKSNVKNDNFNNSVMERIYYVNKY